MSNVPMFNKSIIKNKDSHRCEGCRDTFKIKQGFAYTYLDVKTKGTEDRLEKKCYCANTKKTVGNYNFKLRTKKVVENAIRGLPQWEQEG